MRGDLVFETLGGVDAHFILEADPNVADMPVGVVSPDISAKRPKGHRPHGGWAAAAVCAVVAFGVYLGMMWLGQGQWEPPATTEEGTSETIVTAPDETTDENVNETTDETTPPNDGLVEPSPTFVNPHYVVEEIEGQYYLNFYEGNKIYSGMAEPYVSFESVEEMFLSLYYGDLDENQQQWLANLYVTTSGYVIPNICDLAAPILEADGEISAVKLYGANYSFIYTVPSLELMVEMDLQKNQRTDGWAAEMVANQGQDTDTRTEAVIDGMSAVITTDNTGAAEFKTVYLSYVDEATGNEIYAAITYLLSTSVNVFPNLVSDTIPWEVEIMGTRGGKQFTVHFNNSFHDMISTDLEISKDFLSSFMIEPFDTPRVEPMATIEKEPYELMEEDGTWYLTFPEWDGELPDGLAHAVGQVYPAFASVIDLYNDITEQDMSLYHQVLFMLNADENGRVHLPDPNTLLSPSFPETHMKAPVIKFNSEGFYDGYMSCTDCTGDHYAGFGVMSETDWQERLRQEIPVANDKDILSVTAVEGMYDGLPCTFYEYTYMSYGFKETSVLCHIKPEGDHREQEYFLNIFGPLDNVMGDDTSINAEYTEILDAYDISVYGTVNGQYYQFTLSGLDAPTAERLKGFSVTPILP